MTNLHKRIVSALVLLTLLCSVYYFAKTSGVIIFGCIFILLGANEYQRIVFSQMNPPRSSRILFLFTCGLLVGIMTFITHHIWSIVMLLIAIYFSAQLWLLNNRADIDKTLSFLSLSGLGFLYCVFFPVTALKLLQLNNGESWFLLLISVVFAGDIFSYFGGILLGKKKLMPTLSPGKTVVGSVSGIIGSGLAGTVVWWCGLDTLAPYYVILASLLSAVLAQNGDLLESLVKRVSSVKDSGAIFPGHGGVLDRLDGVYFAAPAMYFAALFSNT